MRVEVKRTLRARRARVSSVDQQLDFDRLAALSPIAGLPDDQWEINEHGVNMAILVQRKGGKKRTSRFQFLRLRHDRPHESGRDRRPKLVELAADSRVTEFTLAVMWPDGYMAALSSRDAPNIKYLSTYFDRTSGQRCRIVDLYASDVVQRLRALKGGGLTAAEVKIRSSVAQQIENDEKLRWFRAFWAAGRGREALTVDVRISVDRARNRYLDQSVIDVVERLATYGDLVDKLKVTGRNADGEKDEINLRNERRAIAIEYDENEEVGSLFARIEAARCDLLGGSLDESARLE